MVEKSLFGFGVAVLGILTVFAGLVILIVFIKCLSAAMSGVSKKAKQKTKTEQAKASVSNDEVSGDVLAAITAALNVNNETVSSDIVAAIAAALHVVMGETPFVVRRVKRIQNASAWNRAGREEQVYSRF